MLPTPALLAEAGTYWSIFIAAGVWHRESKYHCVDRILHEDSVVAYIQHSSLQPLSMNNLPR